MMGMGIKRTANFAWPPLETAVGQCPLHDPVCPFVLLLGRSSGSSASEPCALARTEPAPPVLGPPYRNHKRLPALPAMPFKAQFARDKPRRRDGDSRPGRRVKTGGRQCQWRFRPRLFYCDRIDTGLNHASSLRADLATPRYGLHPRVRTPLGGMLSIVRNACVRGGLGPICASHRAGKKTFIFSIFYTAGAFS